MTVLANLDLTKIQRGFPVHVYLDLAFNSDGTVKNLGADGTVVVADHPVGIELGYTQDGAEISVNQTREGLMVDQRNTEVLPSLTGQEPHLKVGYLQVLDMVTLAALIPGAAHQSGTGFEGVSDQVDQSITLHNVVAIAPLASDKTKFHVLIIYACSNIAPLLIKLSKAYGKMPLDFKGEDAGRADGKTWFAYKTTA